MALNLAGPSLSSSVARHRKGGTVLLAITQALQPPLLQARRWQALAGRVRWLGLLSGSSNPAAATSAAAAAASRVVHRCRWMWAAQVRGRGALLCRHLLLAQVHLTRIRWLIHPLLDPTGQMVPSPPLLPGLLPPPPPPPFPPITPPPRSPLARQNPLPTSRSPSGRRLPPVRSATGRTEQQMQIRAVTVLPCPLSAAAPAAL